MSALVGVLLALVLVTSGMAHLRGPATTAGQLRAHAIVPVGPATILGLAAAELGLAAWLTAGVLGVGVTGPALVLAGAFLLGCAGYLALVRARGGTGLPCGCGLGDAGVGGWSITRAVALGGAGVAAGAAALDGVTQSPIDAAEWIIVTLAAATFALLAAILPVARPAPEVLR